MRCKYCDSVLEPFEYEWDEELKDWIEIRSHTNGACLDSNKSNTTLADLVEELKDD